MTSPDRFFPNSYPDYDPSKDGQSEDKLINKAYLHEFTLEKAFLCMSQEKPKATSKYCDGGIYTGNLGLIFMCFKVLKSSEISLPDEQRRVILTYVSDLYEANKEYYATNEIKQSRDISYLCGKGGFYVMAAVALSLLGRDVEAFECAKIYASFARVCQPLEFLKGGSDEMFVGRAGFLCGILALRKYLNIEVLPESELFVICDAIIQSGRNYAMKTLCPCPLMYAYHESEYLGSAHGLAGILQMLLSFPNYLSHNHQSAQYVRQSVDFLLSLRKPNGNYPSSMSEHHPSKPRDESKDLVHWCHGSAGVVHTFARAWLLWKDEKYLNACRQCDDVVWERGLLRKGPGICHGVGSSGYVHLLLYRLTGELKYLHRAARFADFLATGEFKNGARTPDRPFSLFEGLAGTVCFAVDLMDPKNAEYPAVPEFI